MLCERCKIREANIQYTEVINGVKTDHHFCAQCAKEMDFGQYSALFEGEFPFARFLSALLGAESPSRKSDKYEAIVCPSCGMTYQEFVDNSSFGCADCYHVFDVLIHDHIKQIQGSDCHNGKRPVYQSLSDGEPEEPAGQDPEASGEGTRISYGKSGAGGEASGPADPEEARRQVQIRIRRLESRLREALQLENYEDAARLRDQIRDLKEAEARTRD